MFSSPSTTTTATTVQVIAPATLNAGSKFEAVVDGKTFTVTVPAGGVKQEDVFEVPYPASVVMVMAPNTLQAGDMFEAEVDGIKFMAIVPEGGVGKGDLFEAPNPAVTAVVTATATATEVGAGSNDAAAAFVVPTGKWRTELCDCCAPTSSTCCLCVMGYFCTPILMAQVMQRMKYSFFGCPAVPQAGDGDLGYNKYVCIVFTVLAFTAWVFWVLLVLILRSTGVYFLLVVWAIFMVVVFTCARISMRKKYNINRPPAGNTNDDDCCLGVVDFFTVFCCSCCSAIQMAGHTHDGKKYPYNMLTKTGLDDDAPEIV